MDKGSSTRESLNAQREMPSAGGRYCGASIYPAGMLECLEKEGKYRRKPRYGKVLPGTENRSDLIARGVTESGLENRASRGSDTRPKAQAFCLQ